MTSQQIVKDSDESIESCDETINEIDNEILTEENEKTGVIYCITNDINNKKYIGQALSYIYNRGKLVKHGITGRFKYHIKCALKGNEDCPKLYNSIRKYGQEHFSIELVEICKAENLNTRETFYIKKMNTLKDGYNVSVGVTIANLALWKLPEHRLPRCKKISNTLLDKWQDPEYKEKTTKANLEAVIKRADEGKTRKEENKELPTNIYKNDDNGYDIRIMRGGNFKITSVTDVEKPDSELLELAIKKRDELLKHVEEKGEFDKHQKKLDHNNNPLPKCIACIVARGNPGYQITYEKAGKIIRKSFTDKTKSMDDKLESAKKYLEELQNDFQGNIDAKEVEKQNDRLDHNKNPLPDRIFKYHQRGVDGYRCIIKKDGKDVKYVCCGKTTSLDDKLASCKKWLEENNL